MDSDWLAVLRADFIGEVMRFMANSVKCAVFFSIVIGRIFMYFSHWFFSWMFILVYCMCGNMQTILGIQSFKK